MRGPAGVFSSSQVQEGCHVFQGHLVADPKKYPNGIRGLSAYAHQRGLKVGIYSDAG